MLTEMPATSRELETVQPVYECLPGWMSSTAGVSRLEDLPAGAKDYLAFLADKSGVEVGCVSTGPERNETITITGSRFAQLMA